MGVSENSVPLNPMVLLIIIPIKWLFHWEYTLFSTHILRHKILSTREVCSIGWWDCRPKFHRRPATMRLALARNDGFLPLGMRYCQPNPVHPWTCVSICILIYLSMHTYMYIRSIYRSNIDLIIINYLSTVSLCPIFFLSLWTYLILSYLYTWLWVKIAPGSFHHVLDGWKDGWTPNISRMRSNSSRGVAYAALKKSSKQA